MHKPFLLESPLSYFDVNSSIGQTKVFVSAIPGIYRINYCADAKNAVGSGTFELTLVDLATYYGSQSPVISLSPSGLSQGSFLVYLYQTNGALFEVDFSTTVSGFTTNPTYSLWIAVERLTGDY